RPAAIVTEPAVRDDRPVAPTTAGIEVGATIGDARVAAIATDNDDQRLDLARADGTLLHVRLRRWDPARPAPTRRGSWAIELDSARDPGADELALLRGIAQLLPEGSRGEGNGAPILRTTSRPRADILCTAPWTTLEVVDPDGRARQ